MGGKIEIYEDCVSLYTYFAFLRLEKIRAALKDYDVEVIIHPVFLGGIISKSGNEPPWKLAVRGKYLKYDRIRAETYFKSPQLKIPNGFPPNTLLPQRAATYIAANYESSRLEAAVIALSRVIWEPPNVDVSTADGIRQALAPTFSHTELDDILNGAGNSDIKKKLVEVTDEALERGAYGCPWFWVTNSEGKSEPFFGSDRFHYIYQFLGIPFKDIEIVSKTQAGNSKL